MSQRIYIAASLEDLARADAFARRLELHGAEIVSDWHRDDGNTRAAERQLTQTERRAICEHNYSRVRAADVVVVLASPTMRGTIAEAAYAYACHKVVIAIGDHRAATLMLAFALWHPDEQSAVGLVRAVVS